MQYLIKFAILITLLSGCNNYNTKYPYSISDFRPELRMHLEKLVSETYICDNNEAALNYLDNHTSKGELKKLIKSEHPILRAFAFKYLSLRRENDMTKLLLENLDDSAKIMLCKHTGDYSSYLTDLYLNYSKGKTTIPKVQLIDTILSSFNYLDHTYDFANEVDTANKKNYQLIKQVAEVEKEDWSLRKKRILLALSSYRNKKDVSFLANAFLSHFLLYDYTNPLAELISKRMLNSTDWLVVYKFV